MSYTILTIYISFKKKHIWHTNTHTGQYAGALPLQKQSSRNNIMVAPKWAANSVGVEVTQRWRKNRSGIKAIYNGFLAPIYTVSVKVSIILVLLNT